MAGYDETEGASVATSAERILAHARELVALSWCQDASARNADGEPVAPESPTARSWSAEGALARAWTSLKTAIVNFAEAEIELERAQLALAAAVGDVGGWNDARERTREEVLNAFDRAIELANEVSGSRVTSQTSG